MKKNFLFFAALVSLILMASCGNKKSGATEPVKEVDNYKYQTSDSISPENNAHIKDGKVILTYGTENFNSTTFTVNLGKDTAKGVYLYYGNCYIITGKNELMIWQENYWIEEDGQHAYVAFHPAKRFKGIHAIEKDSTVNEYGYALETLKALDANGKPLGTIEMDTKFSVFGGFEGTFATILSINDEYISFHDEDTKETYEGYCKIVDGPDDGTDFQHICKPYTVEYEFISRIPSKNATAESISVKGKIKVQTKDEYEPITFLTPLEGFNFHRNLNQTYTLDSTW